MQEFTLPHSHGEGKSYKRLHERLSNTESFEFAGEMFKILGDTTRIKIFWLLCHREECVINIAAMLGITSPAVSHHLKPLKELGLIQSHRDGKEVYYTAADTEESRLLHKVTEKVMAMNCPKATAEGGESRREIVHKVHEYMLKHLSERITIEELSRRFLLNTTTLKQEFKNEYGVSVAAHIKKHRLEKAAELLGNTDKGIGEIAGEVGYESQSRFTAAFKEQYGVIPSEYRKSYRGEKG